MTDEPALQSPVLAAIAAGPLAWSTTLGLAAGLGLTPGAVLVELAGLLAAGLVETWPDYPTPDDSTAVTLTPYAAELLNLDLVEHGTDELPRWTPATFNLRGVRTFEPVQLRAAGMVKTEARRAITGPRTSKHGTPPRREYFDRVAPPTPEADDWQTDDDDEGSSDAA